MEKTRSVSFIMPMYNETPYLEKSVAGARGVLESLTNDFEIIIVDDASTDGSEKIADNLAASDTRIKVIHHPKNRKLGGVLKTGFSHAAKEIVIYTDMDMPFDFALLSTFLPLTHKFDIINGRRIDYKESFQRLCYSKVYNGLIRILFGLRVRDVNFAMKIYKRKILEALDLKSEGSFINAEALVKAQYLGYKIIEVSMAYVPRYWGKSRLSSAGVIAKIIYEIFKLSPQLYCLKIKMLLRQTKAGAHGFVRRFTCPFRQLLQYIPESSDVYDFGCGYGNFIHIASALLKKGNRFFGLDIDQDKIRYAELKNGDENVFFETRDIRDDLGLRDIDCITMLDVLMLLPFPEQERLLKRCFNYLSQKGVLLIKEINTRPLWKYTWNQIQETFVLKVFKLIRGQGLYCRSRDNFVCLLQQIGFKVKTVDLQKGYLYPHILYICSR